MKIYKNYKEHPVKALFDQGVKITVNSDDPPFFNASIAGEYGVMKELGYCQGIENYSRYLSGRSAGEPPPCLFDYLPKNSIVFNGLSISSLLIKKISFPYILFSLL